MQKTFRIECWENANWRYVAEVSESTAGKAIKYARRHFVALVGVPVRNIRAVQI